MNNNKSFASYFWIYFKKMFSYQQLLFFVIIFMIIFLTLGGFNFADLFVIIAIMSIIIFFSFNYGLFIFNLKKSHIYKSIRMDNHYQLKNYGSIILNLFILSIFIYFVFLLSIFLGKAADFFNYDINYFNMTPAVDFSDLHFFWFYISILFSIVMIISICFFIENITKNIKTYFIIVMFFIILFLIMEIVILIKINNLQSMLNYESYEDGSVHYHSVENFVWYDQKENVVYASIGLSYIDRDKPTIIFAFFYPFLAMKTILYNSLYNLEFTKNDVSYYFDGIPLNSDTEFHKVFLPHIFHMDFNTYYIDGWSDEYIKKVSYYHYGLYTLVAYFYIFFFLTLGIIFRNKELTDK